MVARFMGRDLVKDMAKAKTFSSRGQAEAAGALPDRPSSLPQPTRPPLMNRDFDGSEERGCKRELLMCW
jgi:hypothetical protein